MRTFGLFCLFFCLTIFVNAQHLEGRMDGGIEYWKSIFPTNKAKHLTDHQQKKMATYIGKLQEDSSFQAHFNDKRIAQILPKIVLISQIIKTQRMTFPDKAAQAQLDSVAYYSAFFSGFSPLTNYNKQKVGWWGLPQFAASKQGLFIDYYADERRDFWLSFEAFIRYQSQLSNLYSSPEFRSLAMVGSPMLVHKKEQQHNTKEFDHLDNEAEELQAFKLLFNFTYNLCEPIFYIQAYQPIDLSQPISFDSLAASLSLEKKHLQFLNPVWKGDFYSPAKGSVPLIIPMDKLDVFLENEIKIFEKSILHANVLAEKKTKQLEKIKKQVPDLSKTSVHKYRVRSGDNLGSIAGRYGVKVSQLRAWNDLRGDNIYAGQKLTIYTGKKPQKALIAEKRSAPQNTVTTTKHGRYVEYTISEGDTLWSISKKFPGVTADEIMELNDIDDNIKPGQLIKIKTVGK